jgi:hypothetical protein
MRRTRFSLFYLATYATLTGVVLLAAPGLAFKLLFSNGNYGEVMPRLVGALILALGIMVIQVIRHRVEVLYPTTLFIRAVLLAVLAGLLVATRDPFFAVVMGVVGLGVAFTGLSYLGERTAKPSSS